LDILQNSPENSSNDKNNHFIAKKGHNKESVKELSRPENNKTANSTEKLDIDALINS